MCLNVHLVVPEFTTNGFFFLPRAVCEQYEFAINSHYNHGSHFFFVVKLSKWTNKIGTFHLEACPATLMEELCYWHHVPVQNCYPETIYHELTNAEIE